MAGGRYPSQSVEPDGAKTSPVDVLFRPAPGARVVVERVLKITASHVEFRGLASPEWEVWGPATDVTIRGVDTDAFWITSASNVRVIGGDVGPAENTASQIRSAYRSSTPSRNILVQGVRFHDYVRTDGSVHMECVHVWGTRGLTFRGNRFRNCAIMDLFIDNADSAGDVRDVLIENNAFDAPGSTSGGLSRGHYPLMMDTKGSSFENVTIRYNSFLGTAYVEPRGSLRNVRMIGNIGARARHHCYEGVTFRSNVWDGARCGPTDRVAAHGFSDPARLDLRLKHCAAGVDRGDRVEFPRIDINGRARPHGGAPDAGAYESSTACKR